MTPQGHRATDAPGPRPPGLAGAVLAQARRTPTAVAVVDGAHTLDYAALDATSAAVAAALYERGVRAGQSVAVCLPRSWQLVCAMLGILRLGATVVPLDAQSPPRRRHHILTDSGSVTLLESLPTTASPPPPVAAPAAVAFVFYTSGTTGNPKGVEVRHAGILRLAEAGLVPDRPARVACLSNPAFDALSFEVWVPLLTGGCCVVLDDATVQSPHLLAAALRRERVDALFVTTALFNAVVGAVPDCFATVGRVLVGGEQLDARIMRRWYRDNPTSPTHLHNIYGPTESTTFALCHRIPRDFDGDIVPIGRPLARTGALLVVHSDAGDPDAADGGPGARVAEPGEVAELYLSGDGLAAGYRNLPQESARRFVRLPWHDGGRERHYRTGDLVLADADGRVVYVGRTDRQVKVRGFRIEPGEVERRLGAHPAVRQVYVGTRRAHGVTELLAFLVLGAELSYEEYERHLADTLPSYMRPHRVHLVSALPLTPNGKVDEPALLRRADPPWRPGAPTASDPRAAEEPVADAELEQAVVELAGQVLGVADVRPGDRWIALGGDSLTALRLRFEVRRRWGRDVPQAAVLHADLAALAVAVRSASPSRAAYPPVPSAAGPTAPATSEQQRLWLWQQQSPGSCAYNVTLAFRLTGTPDVPALRSALRVLVERHAALRTAFTATADGVRQVLGDPYDPWAEPAGRTVAQLAAIPFDLTASRMLRAHWLPEGRGGLFLLCLHHIAVDGWSVTVLLRDLSAAYAGHPLPDDVAPTPLEHAVWQTDWFTDPTYRSRRAALHEHYAAQDDPDPLGATIFTEPTATPPVAGHGPRPDTVGDAGVMGGEGRLLRRTVGPWRLAGLDKVGAELGLTRFQVLLGALACALFGVTGSTHQRIASPVANRPVREFEASVGMFANTVLLPQVLVPGEDVRTQVGRLGAAASAVLDRQDVALAHVLEDLRAPAGTPPFDVLFVLENTDFTALALPGCPAGPEWQAPPGVKCPLTLSVVEHDGRLQCLWEHSGVAGAAELVDAVASLFDHALDTLTGDTAPAALGVTLAGLVGPYRRSLPDHGRGPSGRPEFTTVAEGFAAQVNRTPDAIALVAADRRPTYAELDAHAGALAADLLRRFPQSRDRDDDRDAPNCVALHLEPSVEHVVALLALARLNLTIVPLDPAYPPALLRQVLDQVRPLCVLVSPDGPALPGADDLPRHPITLSTVDSAVVAPQHVGRPLYTLFTSGSTGAPKGVRVPDSTLCNLLHWQATHGGLAPRAVTQQFSMLAFDVSFQEILGTLCGGGELHLVRPHWRHDLPALLRHLDSAGIERLFLPSVALQLLAEHGVHLGVFPSRLRDVVTAGEQLVCTDAVRRWFAGLAGARLFNHYGPTETHVVSGLCLDGDPAGWPTRPAIGRPVGNAWLRVVDAADEPMPPGGTGRLLVGGTMAMRCYVGDPAPERFVTLPELGLCYRTGDLARFDRDGLLHYVGRDDQQVKLSGHRVELGQVEAALLQHPEVVGAVVVADGGRLVACLRCRDVPPSPVELAEHLAVLLPAHVRIDRYRALPELPRTASGKLDRRAALTALGADLDAATAPRALTPRETRLTALFEAAVGGPVAPDQRFFDAGATSLGLMRFHLRCTAELGVPLTIADLFEHVTIRDLAAHLDGAAAHVEGAAGRPAATAHAATARPSGPVDEPVAVVGMAVRLPGADDLAAFWRMVESGGRGIEYFDAADGLVGARSQLGGPLAFDPDHFGIAPHEARLMDPQQRHLLMSCVQALAHAGIADPAAHRVGLVAGCGENTYFQAMLREADPAQLPDGFQLALHHDKDFLTTKVAYHLGLTGPAFTVQAACASSLVAVHVAAGLLRQGDSEVMLAGGVLVDTLLADGYRYRPQHIFSRDGHCRPFSDDSSGTVGASGVGVVVLKPLRLARRDGDIVYSVITGSAVNNDGAGKIGYSAPSLAGQREVIRSALRRSGRTGADLGYVEAHGTGTRLGDPVEVGALRQAFDLPPGAAATCALASVKSQLGHLGAAAGVVGLVRAVLAVHHGVIPPNVDFHRLNPEIGPDAAPFHIPVAAHPWPDGRPRVAAVSSFGIGGTNAHVILEAAPVTPVGPPMAERRLVLSSSSDAALRVDAARIADYLEANPQAYDRVLAHLTAGRPARRYRVTAACSDVTDAIVFLRATATGAGSTLGERDVSHPTAAGPAQAPWDFPPPSFHLTDHDFPRPAETIEAVTAVAGEWPERLPEQQWLHQPQWVRVRRAGRVPAAGRTVVIVTAEPLPPVTLGGARVVRVTAAGRFARLGEDRYQVDPADPASLRELLTALGAAGVTDADWLHALPLATPAVGGSGGGVLDGARWACVDTPAALVRVLAGATGGPTVRPWWLSCEAQPVNGAVRRPELGLLAGICEVAPQECSVDGRWLDLPGPEPADWADLLPDLLADATPLPAPDSPSRRLALRDGYWWHSTTVPVPAPPDPAAAGWTPAAATAPPEPTRPAAVASTGVVGDGTWVVLGGTGGIGSAVARWLLVNTGSRVLLLARRPYLPEALRPWAERVGLVEADLTGVPLDAVAARIAEHLAVAADGAGAAGVGGGGLRGVVHAAGVPAGALVAGRDPAAMRSAMGATLRGALLTELLIERHEPELALYCSSMSAVLGGVGQLDYAAANGLLDGFAHHRATPSEVTVRVGVNWDVWRETGMATRTLRADARHQAHLAVGLTVEEGERVLGHALRLRLPQLLVSTTALDRSVRFYRAPDLGRRSDNGVTAAALGGEGLAEVLVERLGQWLGVERIDPDVSLYDLGADSLTMLDLIDEVKRHRGVELELSRLGHRVSLTEVLALLDERPTADPVELQVWRSAPGAELVCLVHPVGGDLQAYRPLVAALDPRFTVCLIADPALGRADHPAWSITERAAHYAAALRARFPADTWRMRLAGWSFGAWVALAMAAEAEAAGAPAAALHLIDPPAPAMALRPPIHDEAELRALFAAELRHNGTGPGGRSAGGATDRAYAERLARCCRANLASMAGWTLPRLTATPAWLWHASRPESRPDGRSASRAAGPSELAPTLPAVVASGRNPAAANGDEWGAHLSRLAGRRHLPTTHYGIVGDPHAGTVAAGINATLPALAGCGHPGEAP